MSTGILKKLEGGDPQAMVQVYLVTEEVEDNPELLAELFEGATGPVRLVRLRAGMVIARVARSHPEYFAPYSARLIEVLAKASQRMYRRDLINLFPRLNLTGAERQHVSEVLHSYLVDQNVTVVISSMRVLVEFAGDDPEKQVKLLPVLDKLIRTGMPDVRAKARRAHEKLFQSLTAEE